MNHNVNIWYVTPKGVMTHRLRTTALGKENREHSLQEQWVRSESIRVGWRGKLSFPFPGVGKTPLRRRYCSYWTGQASPLCWDFLPIYLVSSLPPVCQPTVVWFSFPLTSKVLCVAFLHIPTCPVYVHSPNLLSSLGAHGHLQSQHSGSWGRKTENFKLNLDYKVRSCL